jgi:hypothetical protein
VIFFTQEVSKMRKMFLFLAMSLITVFFILTNPLVSMANVRIEFGTGTGTDTVVPAYANLGAIMPDGTAWTINTDEWAAIPFYRDPDCVPEDFNLALFFDFNALDCYSFMEGLTVWENGPDTDPAPMQVKYRAAEPMPVYFIPWPILQEALEDSELTMPELEGLEGLRIGFATFYTETLHAGVSVPPYMNEAVAKGHMTDNGDGFALKYTWIHEDLVPKSVRIDFRPAKSAPASRPQPKLAATWGEIRGR